MNEYQNFTELSDKINGNVKVFANFNDFVRCFMAVLICIMPRSS